MSRNRESDCCEYREEKRRLARKKLRMKMEASKNAKKKRDDDCDDEDEDEEAEIEEERKCEEKRAQRVEALSKLLSLGDEMMRKIKPSIEERDKYSMDYRHIRCFLEPAEIERMDLEKKMRRIFKCMPCELVKNQRQKFDKYRIPAVTTSRKKKRKKKTKDKDKGPIEVVDGQEEVENKSNLAIESEEEESRPNEEKEESKKEKEKEKSKDKKEKSDNKGEFWCREVKKKEKPKRDEQQFEIDCKDSICSFDSELDLSGLALTKDDLKNIAEMRRSKIASKSKVTM